MLGFESDGFLPLGIGIFLVNRSCDMGRKGDCSRGVPSWIKQRRGEQFRVVVIEYGFCEQWFALRMLWGLGLWRSVFCNDRILKVVF